MATIRSKNWLGNQRADSPHLREVEAGVRGDLDLLAGQMLAGGRPLVVKGYTLAAYTLGNLPELLELVVDGGVSLHYGATASGTLFSVPAGRVAEPLAPTNPRVSGSFSAGAANYVGLDIRRAPDDSTKDFVTFLDEANNTESQRQVPLAETLDYVIVITTLPFSATPTLLPLLVVTTNGSGLTASVQDARNLLGRLGAGGDVPDYLYGYAWPQGRRESLTQPFVGGDRAIESMREWMEAMMTRVWEVAGGERWTSAVSDRNVKLTYGTTTFANGENFSWDGTDLLWQGLTYKLPNSTALTNAVADQTSPLSGLTNLADGDCIYVDLDYGADHVGGSALGALRAPLKQLGAPAPYRSRTVLAWRAGSSIYTRDSAIPVGQGQLPDAVQSLPLIVRVVTSCETTPIVQLQPLGTFYVKAAGQWTTLTISMAGSLDIPTIFGAGLAADTRYYLYVKNTGGSPAYEVSTTQPSPDFAWATGPDQTRALITTFCTDGSGDIVEYAQSGRHFSQGGRVPSGPSGNLILDAGTATTSTSVTLTECMLPTLAVSFRVQGQYLTSAAGPHTAQVGYLGITGIDGMTLFAKSGRNGGGQCQLVIYTPSRAVKYMVEDGVNDALDLWIAGFDL